MTKVLLVLLKKDTWPLCMAMRHDYCLIRLLYVTMKKVCPLCQLIRCQFQERRCDFCAVEIHSYEKHMASLPVSFVFLLPLFYYSRDL